MKQRDKAYIEHLEKENKRKEKALTKLLIDQESTRDWFKYDLNDLDCSQTMIEVLTKNIELIKRAIK